MRTFLVILFLLLLLLSFCGVAQGLYTSSEISFDASSGSYDGINIVVKPNRNLNASHCPRILRNLKVRDEFPCQNEELFLTNLYFQNVVSSASGFLFERLKEKFGKVNIRIPKTWTDDHCYKESHIQSHQPFMSKVRQCLIIIVGD